MTGLDTNVLVRYLTRDDAGQYERAKDFLEIGRLNEAAGCAETATFDRQAGSLTGFRVL